MVASNNGIYNTVGASISGVTNTLTVTNLSNTASSAARETIVVGGGTAADPTINWNVSGVTNWEMGIDNSVSDNLTISQSAALGTKDVWRMDVNGARIMPLQPTAIVRLVTPVLNATGDGTNVQIVFDGVLVDQAANYNVGTGVFTAPVTGNYLITAQVSYNGLTAAHTGALLLIVTTPIQFWCPSYNPFAVRSLFTANQSTSNSQMVRMTAGDTSSIHFVITGGAKVCAINGSGVTNEYCAASWTLID